VANHRLALLDTSCAIDLPERVEAIADRVMISALTVAELAFGLYQGDPYQQAAREARYRKLLEQFEPVPYSARAAHLYGAIAESVRRTGRDPRPRRIDLMIASVAAEFGAVLLTANPGDYKGVEDFVSVITV